MSYQPSLFIKRTLVLFALCFFSVFANAEDGAEGELVNNKMDNERLEQIIQRLDDNFEGSQGFWNFNITNVTVTVVTDEKNDRMRIIIPITESEKLSSEDLYRIMQANFDSTLDGRYAIGKNILWSTYLHPLASLTDDEFLTGLGQTVNLYSTFGTTYSSGLLSYGGGDSQSLLRKKLIEELIEKGVAI